MQDYKQADCITYLRAKDGDSMYVFFLACGVLVHYYAANDYGYFEVDCETGKPVEERRVR
jgi:hypothetical protein